jgi:hypothetical protein
MNAFLDGCFPLASRGRFFSAARLGGNRPQLATGKAPLMTRWASAVSPTNAHPEYPRPQLVRTDWQNLNGLWDYAVRPQESGPPKKYDGEDSCAFSH